MACKIMYTESGEAVNVGQLFDVGLAKQPIPTQPVTPEAREGELKLFQESGKLVKAENIDEQELQSTIEYELLEDQNKLGIKTEKPYIVLSEKTSDKIVSHLNKSRGVLPKDFFDEARDVRYMKSNNRKNSLLYNMVDYRTGEVLAEKVRIFLKDEFEKRDIQEEIKQKFGFNLYVTKKYSSGRSISFTLYRELPGRKKFLAQAKKYLYDALKLQNPEITGELARINLKEIDNLLSMFPEDMWKYINTTYTFESNTNKNASTNRVRNAIKFDLPKLGLIRSLEKQVGIKLLGKSFKNYDRSGGLNKIAGWGESITITNKLTRRELDSVLRYYLVNAKVIKETDQDTNARKYAEHKGLNLEELNEVLAGYGYTTPEIQSYIDSYRKKDYSNTMAYAAWQEAVLNYNWQYVEMMSAPYDKFNKEVSKYITEKFKDKILPSGESYLDYFFSGKFNWININFNSTSGVYYLGEDEYGDEIPEVTGVTETPVTGYLQTRRPSKGSYLKAVESYNRLAAVLHEPFHALHALSYGSREEKEMRSAFDSLVNTEFGKKLMEEVFGDGYNNQAISGNTLYKEFMAFAFQLMNYPKDWLTRTDLKSNDMYDFIQKVQTLQDKTYTEIVKRREQTGTAERIVSAEEEIRLNFLEKLYNLFVSALNRLIPLSKQWVKSIESSKIVEKTVIDDVFAESEAEVTRIKKLPQKVVKAKEEFLNALDDVKASIETLMNVDTKIFSSENINNFFQEESYPQISERPLKDAEPTQPVTPTVAGEVEEAEQKLKGFSLLEEGKKLCPSGVCNFTALSSTKKLKDEGLNPYPNYWDGNTLSVSVGSPVGDFSITHYVSAVALDNSLYIYDMPQQEFIGDVFYGEGAPLDIKREYIPRLIPLTLEEIKANYNLNTLKAAKFIKSIINARGHSNIPESIPMSEYITNNISNSFEYLEDINNLLESVPGINVSYKEIRDFKISEEKLEREDIIKKIKSRPTIRRVDKVAKFIESKLKVSSRAYVARDKSEDRHPLKEVIKSIAGDISFKYDRNEGLKNTLKRLKDHLRSTELKDFLVDRAANSIISIEKGRSNLALMLRDRVLVKSFINSLRITRNIEETISKFDGINPYRIRSILKKHYRDMEMTTKNIDKIYYTLIAGTETIPGTRKMFITKKEILLDLAINKSILEKSTTILDYLNIDENAPEYLHDIIREEVNRRLEYFGKDFYQISSKEEALPDAQINSKIKSFLRSLGVKVDELADRLPEGAIAMADLLNNVIKVVEGRAKIDTLPEEAAHFFVELLPKDSGLYKSMRKKALADPIMEEVRKEYGKAYDFNENKLVKEAMGKLIAKQIISGDSSLSSYMRMWWNKLILYLENWMRERGVRANFDALVINSFGESAQRILRGDTATLSRENMEDSFFLQKATTEQEKYLMRHRVEASKITKDFEEGKHDYFYNGVKVLKHVTQRVTDWIRDKYPNLVGNIEPLSRDAGINLHADFENVGKILNGEKGVVKAVRTDPETYAKIEEYLKALMASYPDGTEFLIEHAIYDPQEDEATTIDFLAIEPDGTHHVHDWKGIKFKTDSRTGEVTVEMASNIKRKSVDIQILGMKRILMSQNYKVEKFGHMRANPARIKIQKVRQSDTGKLEDEFIGYEIGHPDWKEIEEGREYLTPIPSSAEKTGVSEIDKIVEDLYNKLDDLEKRQPKNRAEKEYIWARIDKVRKAVSDLQVKLSFEGLISFGLSEIPTMLQRLESVAFKELNNDDKSKEMIRMGDYLKTHLSVVINLGDFIDTLSKIDQSNMEKINYKANRVLGKIKKIREHIIEESASEARVEGVFDPAKEEGFWGRWIRTIGQTKNPIIQTFFGLVQKKQNQIRLETEEKNKIIDRLRDAVVKSKPGKAGIKLWEDILEFKNGKWTGNLLNIFSSKFFDDRDEKIKQKDGWKWVEDNTIADKERYDKTYKEYSTVWRGIRFSEDEQLNEIIFNKKLRDFKSRYDVWDKTYKKQALLNPKNYFLRPKDKWHTTKYKSLMKDPSKKAVKEFYEFFVSEIEKTSEWAPIDRKRNFVPPVPATIVDHVINNGISLSKGFSGFLEGIRMESEDLTFGQVGADGEIKNEIPLYFSSPLKRFLSKSEEEKVSKLALKKGKKNTDEYIEEYNSQKFKIIREKAAELKSSDLSRVLSLYLYSASNYKYMSQIEGTSSMLKDALRDQEEILTDFRGKPALDPKGDIQTKAVSGETLEQFNDYILSYIYGRKKKHKAVGVDIKGDTYSIAKVGYGLITLNSIRLLSLNAVSGVANAFNGMANLYMEAAKGRKFTGTDVTKGYRDLAFGWSSTRAIISFFDIQLDSTEWRKSFRRASSQTMRRKLLTLERFFVLQKTGDMTVQWGTLLAYLNSHTVREGKIVRKESKEKSLFEAMSVKKGEVTLPSISQEEFDRFRNMVKETNMQVLGQMNPYDIARMRMTLTGAVIGQFRTWIPRMADERFGEIRYNRNLGEWEYGKYRSFFKHLLNEHFLPLLGEAIANFGFLGYGTGTWGETSKQRALALFQRAKLDDPTLKITEEEYVALHLQNLRAMLMELYMISAVMTSFWALSALDDDEDSGWYKYLAKVMDRFADELLFFMLPSSTLGLLKSFIPITSLLSDIQNFIVYGGATTYYGVFGEEEDFEKYAKRFKKVSISLTPALNGFNRFLSYMEIGED